MTTATQTKTFKLLAADKLAEEGLDFIRSQPDAELVYKPGLSEDELAAIVGEHDGMIVRSGVQVTSKILANPGQLKVIARAGVGVDNIDLQAATSKGILVMNSAEASTVSTAEHAFTLMMSLARNIGPAHRKMADGGWDRGKFMGVQLSGKTLGIVGFGRIGQTIAKRALAFDMNVLAYDPFINATTMLDGRVRMYRDFMELIPLVDFVTFHVPLNDQTRGMMGPEAFKICRPGLRIINASRGGVVDESALLTALDAGQCAGAALDVYETEPPAADSPLRGHDKILTAPHLGASTKEAQQAVSIAAAEQLLGYLRGEGIRGAVNAGGLRVDLDPLQTRFVDLAQRMAKIISPMITRGVSEVSIQIEGEDLAPAAGTIERTTLVNLLQSHLADALNIINVSQVAESRGIKVKTATADGKRGGPRLILEIKGPKDTIDESSHPADKTRRIVGSVYDDMRPRILEINGYHMDMIPSGCMMLIQNNDQPGMIGTVGTELGAAQVNIADMTISRRDKTALMVLKVDNAPSEELMSQLPGRPGILKIATVHLAEESQ